MNILDISEMSQIMDYLVPCGRAGPFGMVLHFSLLGSFGFLQVPLLQFVSEFIRRRLTILSSDLFERKSFCSFVIRSVTTATIKH